MLRHLGSQLRRAAANSSIRGGTQLAQNGREAFVDPAAASASGRGIAAWVRAAASQAAEPARQSADRASQGEETKTSASSNSGESPRQRPQDLVAVFTCSKCGTRSAKGFSRLAYEQGVVIVRCPGCQVQHLMADHLGWFGESATIEDILTEKGQDVVKRRADGTSEILPEHIIGWSRGNEAAHSNGKNN